MGAGIASPYYIDDRENDVLISGGENIYPAEIENILSERPQIAEPSSSAASTATEVEYR